MSLYKRLTLWLVAIVICLSSAMLLACGDNPQDKGESLAKFSVNYLDVGEGNCVVVRFPDGKTLLMDGGSPSKTIYNNIKSTLDSLGVNKIDYFLLSHPDDEHIGNAPQILTDYTVETVFCPYIISPELFPVYEQILGLIDQKGITKEYSQMGVRVVEEDYCFAMLLPQLVSDPTGAYYDFNLAYEPTKKQADALSPIVYLECLGVRFLFTGDTTSSQENYFINLHNIGYYREFFASVGMPLTLENIDYLMLSNGGDINGNSYEFLSVTKPKNVVISVGGNNYYGHPSSYVLNRVLEVNPECKMYRTDVYGNVCVRVNQVGISEVTTSLNK